MSMLLLFNQPAAASADFSSATTDAEDVLAGAVGPIVGVSSATTDGTDVLAAQVGPVVAFSCAVSDGVDVLSAAMSPTAGFTGASTEGADVLAAAVSPIVGASSATVEGEDVLAAAVDTSPTSDASFSGDLNEGEDAIAATLLHIDGGGYKKGWHGGASDKPAPLSKDDWEIERALAVDNQNRAIIQTIMGMVASGELD